jgi:hypothetical protein
MLTLQLRIACIHTVHVQRVYRGHLGRAAAASVKRNKQRGILQYSSTTDDASAVVTAHALLMLQLTRQVTYAYQICIYILFIHHTTVLHA